MIVIPKRLGKPKIYFDENEQSPCLGWTILWSKDDYIDGFKTKQDALGFYAKYAGRMEEAQDVFNERTVA